MNSIFIKPTIVEEKEKEINNTKHKKMKTKTLRE